MKQKYLRIPALFGIFLLLLCSFGINKMYVQAQGDFGWIFHIFRQKLPAETNGQHPESVNYDYTYAEKNDSVALLCTIRLSGAERVEDLSISICDTLRINTPPTLIYARPWKRGTEYRLQTSLAFSAWEQMYACPTAFTLSFHVTHPRDRNKSYRFSYSDKQWEKHRDKIGTIIEIIKINTGKNDSSPFRSAEDSIETLL